MVVRKSRVGSIFFGLLILLIVFSSVFPFLQMLSTSLKYPQDWGNPSLIPKQINLSAYREILNLDSSEKELPEAAQRLLRNPNLTDVQRDALGAKFRKSKNIFPFYRFLGSSFLFAGTSALITVIIAVFGAYSFSRLQYRGRGTIQRGVLFVYMFGGTLLVIPLYSLAVQFGMLRSAGGTFSALILIYMVLTLPVALYMLGNYFRTIPYSIEESASIDGCNRFFIIVRIVVPLSATAIATVYIYCFMIAWNEYLFASVFLKSYEVIKTLPLGLKALFTSKNAIWDRIMAASLLSSMPVIVLFMSFQRYLVAGMSAGGVKE
ncbi:carbohydrate ABC transporter permease [Candidatus Haliotispira prima]|uniref:Carbohydrate ABC transporter permease n=1 Tax=Candidatus Haliotispira prima TaxID=3034016 RepID=A0ABY8MEZ2_9SPIO|nr:carbohydrate ABC transporter permease [Candidatus Haliotispira prima]